MDVQSNLCLHTEEPAGWWRYRLPKKSLFDKKRLIVWQGEKFDFLRLPGDVDWVQREGFEMGHCLSYLHKEYSDAVANGQIDLYSMIDRYGDAWVDIEVAKTWGCGIRKRYKRPTVLQIRGRFNECPPAERLMPDLYEFLTTYGRKWKYELNDPNFDGKFDPILVELEALKLGISKDESLRRIK